MVKKEKACRACKRLIMDEKACPTCGANKFTPLWKGRIIIVDPDKSEVAKKLGITTPGRYALQLGR